MEYAFSPAGLKRLEALLARAALFAFDFDGTLAPIVPHGASARIPGPTRALLDRLALKAPVAVVSGRPLREVRRLTPRFFRAWAGDHGAEIAPARLAPKEATTTARRQVRAWTRHLEKALAGIPGVWIEVKELSLCVHFRQSPRRREARRKILAAVATLSPGPRALPGKCVVNLLNPALPHKGDAVQTLMRGFRVRHALYVGDDSNDEDVFALADPRICTIRIGKREDSRAALYLRRQTEIDRLLRLLVGALPARPSPRYRGKREENARAKKNP